MSVRKMNFWITPPSIDRFSKFFFLFERICQQAEHKKISRSPDVVGVISISISSNCTLNSPSNHVVFLLKKRSLVRLDVVQRLLKSEISDFWILFTINSLFEDDKWWCSSKYFWISFLFVRWSMKNSHNTRRGTTNSLILLYRYFSSHLEGGRFGQIFFCLDFYMSYSMWWYQNYDIGRYR